MEWLAKCRAKIQALYQHAKLSHARRCDSLAELMGCLVAGCDHFGVINWITSNCDVLLGLPAGKLTGRGFFERIHVADRPAFLNAISDARAGSAPVSTAFRWRGTGRADSKGYVPPEFLWLEMRARRRTDCSMVSKRGQEDRIIAVFRDVTEWKARDAALEDARAAAEQAKLAKEYFLVHVGHELRAPLAAIAGFSELLSDPRLMPEDTEKQCEYARLIHQSSHHLLAVVNSIRDASTIQSGCVTINPERFAVVPLMDFCCDMVELQAKDMGVELLRSYRSSSGEIVTDRCLFTQILVNLLSNAIKFTCRGGSVAAGVKAEADSLLIEVTDTGIGIPADDLDRLGDPFFQATSLLERQHKGTGLGLSIVRGLVGVLGGEIIVASEPGKGTCVRVCLPMDCRGFASEPGISAKIKTISRLPAVNQPDLYKPVVRKIA